VSPFRLHEDGDPQQPLSRQHHEGLFIDLGDNKKKENTIFDSKSLKHQSLSILISTRRQVIRRQ
jgi:hypothetical protein